MKASDIIARANPQPVPKAKRISVAGWFAGYLVIGYKGSRVRYVHGPNVEHIELKKLMKVPFPEALLDRLKKKHGWQTYKVQG
jgi:hypothetical protein